MTVHVVQIGGRPARVPPGALQLALGQLADVDTTDTPTDTPLVLRRGADGVFRPEPAPDGPAGWGDQVRFETGPPTSVDAPDGAIHVDLTSRRIFKHVRSSP